MRFENTELVLFDLDGTLADSAPDIAFSMNAALRVLDLPTHAEERVRDWIGSGAEKLVKRALTGAMDGEPDATLFQQAYVLFSDIYQQNTCQRTRLFPGVRECLDYLKRTQRRIGCVTNKRDRYTGPLLQALGIYHDFDIIISGDTLPTKKPDPLPLLHAAHTLDISPRRGLMVGDSCNDVEAARAAGFGILCVSYGYNNGCPVAATHPDVIVDTLADLPTYLI